MTNGYSKALRLRTKCQWAAFFKHAKPFHIGDVKFYVRTEVKSPSLGVVVRKSVMSRSVDRNRFKRLNREFFRQNKMMLNRYEIVAIAKRYELVDDYDILSWRCLSEAWASLINVLECSKV